MHNFIFTKLCNDLLLCINARVFIYYLTPKSTFLLDSHMHACTHTRNTHTLRTHTLSYNTDIQQTHAHPHIHTHPIMHRDLCIRALDTQKRSCFRLNTLSYIRVHNYLFVNQRIAAAKCGCWKMGGE